MKALYALYDEGDEAERAVRNLRSAGVTDANITVITAEPMEDYEFSHIGGENRLWFIASGGGLLGFILSTSLTVFTERNWAINTGGMPIVAWWPNLIVMFEMTMLGAILATVVSLIVTAGLGRRRPALYDPAINDGKILVAVTDPPSKSMDRLERALQISPTISLKTIQ